MKTTNTRTDLQVDLRSGVSTWIEERSGAVFVFAEVALDTLPAPDNVFTACRVISAQERSRYVHEPKWLQALLRIECRTEVVESMAQVARLGPREWLRRKEVGYGF